MGCDSKHCDNAECEKRETGEVLDLSRIKHKIVVLSGKGGVGKSTIAVNLAVSFMLSGKRVGLLDADLHGPSVPTMLGLEGETARGADGKILPVEVGGLKVISLGFFLPSQDEPVIWRGPMKMTALKQFLSEVEWGELDYLIVDCPPGTGDEPLSICQLIGKLDGAVIVTTPQRVASVDVRKSVCFCRTLSMPVLGIVENMSGFVCPKCGAGTEIFSSGGGREIAEDMGIAFLGSIPIDPAVVRSCDEGYSYIHRYKESHAAKLMTAIAAEVLRLTVGGGEQGVSSQSLKEGLKSMKIAIPLANGLLCAHFGHCEKFALVDVDLETREIIGRENLTPPPHEPGVLPRWLVEKGAQVILAGGMGQRAQMLFEEQGIRVVIGAETASPEQLISDFLADKLRLGANPCDH